MPLVMVTDNIDTFGPLLFQIWIIEVPTYFWGLLLFTKVTYERQRLAILCVVPSPRETLLLPIPSPGFSAKNFLGGRSMLSILVFRWERPQSNNWHCIDIRSSRRSWASNSLANTMVTLDRIGALVVWIMIPRSFLIEWWSKGTVVGLSVLRGWFLWPFVFSLVVAFRRTLLLLFVLFYPLCFRHLLTNTSYL